MRITIIEVVVVVTALLEEAYEREGVANVTNGIEVEGLWTVVTILKIMEMGPI